MNELINLYQTPLSGILFTISIIFVLVIIIFGLKMLLKSIPIKSIKTKLFDINATEDSKEINIKEKTIEKDKLLNNMKVSLPYYTFKQLIELIEINYNDQIKEHEDQLLKIQLYKINKEKECVQNVLSFILDGYETKILKDNKESKNQDIEILNMYLLNDLNDIMIEQLKFIDSIDFITISEQDFNTTIENVSKIILRDLKRAIRKYPLIETNILFIFLESYSDNIKHTIQDILINIKHEGKKYLENKLKIFNDRKEILNKQLKTLFNIEDE
jgi:hypothetical protein